MKHLDAAFDKFRKQGTSLSEVLQAAEQDGCTVIRPRADIVLFPAAIATRCDRGQKIATFEDCEDCRQEETRLFWLDRSEHCEQSSKETYASV